MNGGTLILMIAGFAAFGVGAYLSATEMRLPGISLMGLGLMCQVLTLRQLRLARKADVTQKDTGDAG